MDKLEDVMKMESSLPADFNGVFNFTNTSDEDFVGKWGGKEYHFPANSTSPMVMNDFSPVEVQYIRKKFARDFAEREFFKSAAYGKFKAQETNNDGSPKLNSIHQGGQYSDSELVKYIQGCLKPLPISKVTVKEAPKEKVEDKLSRSEDGELNTRAIDKNTSLRAKALGQ